MIEINIPEVIMDLINWLKMNADELDRIYSYK